MAPPLASYPGLCETCFLTLVTTCLPPLPKLPLGPVCLLKAALALPAPICLVSTSTPAVRKTAFSLSEKPLPQPLPSREPLPIPPPPTLPRTYKVRASSALRHKNSVHIAGIGDTTSGASFNPPTMDSNSRMHCATTSSDCLRLLEVPPPFG